MLARAAGRLLRWLWDNVDLPPDVDRIKIHYSGCTADGGQAMTADIGLQGMRARKDGETVEALDVGVGGGVGEDPTFREWVDATGHETLVELAEPAEVDGYEDPCLNDAKQSWYPFDDGESPAPTDADGQPISADD